MGVGMAMELEPAMNWNWPWKPVEQEVHGHRSHRRQPRRRRACRRLLRAACSQPRPATYAPPRCGLRRRRRRARRRLVGPVLAASHLAGGACGLCYVAVAAASSGMIYDARPIHLYAYVLRGPGSKALAMETA